MVAQDSNTYNIPPGDCNFFSKPTVEHNVIYTHKPDYYGGNDNPYETIKVIDAWELNFNLGNAVKYISRAGKKYNSKVEDLEKAIWYLNHELELIKSGYYE